jgi:hypothetical protein
MLWISFGIWQTASGPIFIRKRIYWNGYKWTPFVRIFWRYCKLIDQVSEDFNANKNTHNFEEKEEVRQVKYANLFDLINGWMIDSKDLDEILFFLKRDYPMFDIVKKDLENLLILLCQMNIIAIKKRGRTNLPLLNTHK